MERRVGACVVFVPERVIERSATVKPIAAPLEQYVDTYLERVMCAARGHIFCKNQRHRRRIQHQQLDSRCCELAPHSRIRRVS